MVEDKMQKKTSLKLSPIEFDLVRTIKSGQCFRYKLEDAQLIVQNGNNKFIFIKKDDEWIIPNDNKTIQFLRIDSDYKKTIDSLKKDKKINKMVQKYSGIRVLRQDLHETIIAFIISSNNNIGRITNSMQSIAPNKLPKPGKILDERLLKTHGLGYRAPHLAATNAKLNSKFLNKLRTTDYDTAHLMLQELPGVGPKVADCVCLFGLDKTEAFPVDVHILRAMQHLFPEQEFKNEKEAKHFAQQRWGKHAGIAQQFIFEWAKDTLGKNKTKRMSKQ